MILFYIKTLYLNFFVFFNNFTYDVYYLDIRIITHIYTYVFVCRRWSMSAVVFFQFSFVLIYFCCCCTYECIPCDKHDTGYYLHYLFVSCCFPSTFHGPLTLKLLCTLLLNAKHHVWLHAFDRRGRVLGCCLVSPSHHGGFRN